jgi:hypothetical protein
MKIFTQYFLKEVHEKPQLKIAHVPTEVGTKNLPNTTLEPHCCNNLLVSCIKGTQGCSNIRHYISTCKYGIRNEFTLKNII